MATDKKMVSVRLKQEDIERLAAVLDKLPRSVSLQSFCEKAILDAIGEQEAMLLNPPPKSKK